MTQISNKLTDAAMRQKLEDLLNDRKTWEAGNYKKSNEELYGLLDRCLQLLFEIRPSIKLIRQLSKFLDANGLKQQANTGLTTKIVRYVFGDCGGRAYTYARVINVAAAEKSEKESMLSFINGRGGIEEIRKVPQSGKPSPAEKAKLRLELAERTLANSKPLIPQFPMVDQLQPSNDNGYRFAAAVVRCNDDGTASIVFGTSNTRIIVALLGEAGKQCEESQKIAAATSQAAAAAQARIDLIKTLSAQAQ